MLGDCHLHMSDVSKQRSDSGSSYWCMCAQPATTSSVAAGLTVRVAKVNEVFAFVWASPFNQGFTVGQKGQMTQTECSSGDTKSVGRKFWFR